MSAIDERYAELGAALGRLGVATSGEEATSDGLGLFRNFQHGSIYWTPSTGANEVIAPIFGEWLDRGGGGGELGYPVSGDVIAPDGVGRISYFERGSIYWSPSSGLVVGAEKVKCIHLHVRKVFGTDQEIERAVDNVQRIFRTIGILVEYKSLADLSAPSLEDLDVGPCNSAHLTREQRQLFAMRGSIGKRDVVAYFVRTISRPGSGCAASPADKPSLVVTSGASRWSLAHELGHLLRLDHINNNLRLMTENGTSAIIDPPPDLGSDEVYTIFQQKNLVKDC